VGCALTDSALILLLILLTLPPWQSSVMTLGHIGSWQAPSDAAESHGK